MTRYPRVHFLNLPLIEHSITRYTTPPGSSMITLDPHRLLRHYWKQLIFNQPTQRRCAAYNRARLVSIFKDVAS